MMKMIFRRLFPIIVVTIATFQLQAQDDFGRIFAEGRRALHSRDFATAIAKYDKCLRINPKSVAAYNNRGIANKNSETWKPQSKILHQQSELIPNMSAVITIAATPNMISRTSPKPSLITPRPSG